MMIVFRDKDGKVINIGPWDYMTMPSVNDESGELIFIDLNPLPDGATSKEEDVITMNDGGLSAARP